MRAMLRFAITALLYGAIHGAADAANGDKITWVQIAFDEIKSASPVTGEATAPLSLVKAIVNAIPQKYIDEAKEDGFDIKAIFAAVESMPERETFELTKKDYHLLIRKQTKAVGELVYPSWLNVKSKDFKVPIPLMITGTAVSVVQFAFSDLKLDSAALDVLVAEVKKTPPGLILKGEDKLMNSWLEIKLE
ncbi:MAG: hypothetical protein AB1656_00230 [Candidatus Omnitrophota bacterium]